MEYTLLQADVPANSEQDKEESLDLKLAHTEKWRKEYAPKQKSDSADVIQRADTAAGRFIFNMLYLKVDDRVQVMLNKVKDLNHAQITAHNSFAGDEDNRPLLPKNLATMAWEALHNHFSPSSPYSTAQRMVVAQDFLQRLCADVNEKDRYAAKMVSNNHPYSLIAQEFMRKPLEDLSLSNLLEALEVQRSSTGAPDTHRTGAAPAFAADALLIGTHMQDNKVVCSRCYKPSTGQHHTASNCRNGVGPKVLNGRRAREHSPPPLKVTKKATKTAGIRGSKAFIAKVEEAKVEAIEKGESAFVVGDRFFRVVEEDGSDTIKELNFYSCSRVSPPAILDCGAQRTVSNTAVGSLRPSNIHIRGVGGVLTGGAAEGTVVLHTTTSTGHKHTMEFPDSLIHPDVGTTLISYHGLLKQGYNIRMHLNGGVTTPRGAKINLTLQDGLWSFPPPPSSPRFKPQLQTNNFWHALASENDSDKIGTIEPSVADDVTADDVLKAQHYFLLTWIKSVASRQRLFSKITPLMILIS